MYAESMKIRIAFFSGTGSTEHVATVFKREFESRENRVDMVRIGRFYEPEKVRYDLLVLCYSVHACNPPLPVVRWIETQREADNKPAAVISVSGGGEVTPNLACRVLAKRVLKRNSFRVFYEKMIAMPSNWIVPTKKTVADLLLNVLPGKAAFCAEEIVTGTKRVAGAGIGNRLISFLGRLEHRGAGEFGRRMAVKENCTGCGVCVRNCPVGNIRLSDNRPVFSGDCVLCLRCLYGCPEKALKPGWGKFINHTGRI